MSGQPLLFSPSLSFRRISGDGYHALYLLLQLQQPSISIMRLHSSRLCLETLYQHLHCLWSDGWSLARIMTSSCHPSTVHAFGAIRRRLPFARISNVTAELTCGCIRERPNGWAVKIKGQRFLIATASHGGSVSKIFIGDGR